MSCLSKALDEQMFKAAFVGPNGMRSWGRLVKEELLDLQSFFYADGPSRSELFSILNKYPSNRYEYSITEFV